MIITSQKELDSATDQHIHINSPKPIHITSHHDFETIMLSGSTVAYIESTSAVIITRDNVWVQLAGGFAVCAGDSHISLYNSAHALLAESATASAFDNTEVITYNNNKVVVHNNAKVTHI